MVIGASTSNLYPMVTEQAIDGILSLGFTEIEVFLNTESEADPAFVRELRRRADVAGARIVSLHPYISGTEPYLLFSAYERRFRDGLVLYRKLFSAAQALGARYVVMHGDKAGGILPEEESIARFEQVYDLGRAYGVTLLQENVVRFRSSDTGYLRAMRRQLGEKAGFVFDLKQCIRCGLAPDEVIDAMGPSLRHVHISDQDAAHDCLMPGKGTNDYAALFRRMQGHGFRGAVMLELYRGNFGRLEELREGRMVLENVLQSL